MRLLDDWWAPNDVHQVYFESETSRKHGWSPPSYGKLYESYCGGNSFAAELRRVAVKNFATAENGLLGLSNGGDSVRSRLPCCYLPTLFLQSLQMERETALSDVKSGGGMKIVERMRKWGYNITGNGLFRSETERILSWPEIAYPLPVLVVSAASGLMHIKFAFTI